MQNPKSNPAPSPNRHLAQVPGTAQHTKHEKAGLTFKKAMCVFLTTVSSLSDVSFASKLFLVILIYNPYNNAQTI
jgi:hypothetical protein